MFKPLVVFSNKLLRADDARIRKIARAVSKPVGSAELKSSAALLLKHLVLNDLDVAFFWLVQRSSFIDISAISSDALLFAFNIEFF